MKLSHKKFPLTPKAEETIAIFVTDDKNKLPADQFPGELKKTAQLIDLSLFKAASGSLEFFAAKGASPLLICGLGEPDALTPEGIRGAAAAVTAFCRGRKITLLHTVVPSIDGMNESDMLRFIAEGLSLSNYSFNRYIDSDEKPAVKHFTFYTSSATDKSIVKEVETVTANVHACRDLVNSNTTESTALDIAREAKKLAAIENVICRVLGKPELEKLKMGLLLAVNKGSQVPPRFVILQYKGGKKTSKSLALVGKGITFDSGGMSLKISGGMEAMRMDMAGAAMTLYAFKTAAELKLKINLTAVIPLTENMLANHAYRPGDVVTSYSGKSVYIGNTDAEGRLILADALAYTVDKLKPDYIIDMATLTGACITTFGETVAALLGSDEELVSSIREAAAASGEQVWPLPILPEYEENMKSDVADLSNMPSEKNAGTIHAASFLKQFTGDTKWAHLDIAGTAWYSKPRSYRPKNATGYGVRLLTEVIKNWNK